MAGALRASPPFLTGNLAGPRPLARKFASLQSLPAVQAQPGLSATRPRHSQRHYQRRTNLVQATSSAGATKEEKKAVLFATRKESFSVEELQKPLAEYMTLPASQYSVLDAERIERIDATSFKCYAHRLKFWNFEVCPVLTVRVDEQPQGCRIQLLSCTLEGSPLVVAQNERFSATMVNDVSYQDSPAGPNKKELSSDTKVKVELVIPPAFHAVPVGVIEGTGNQVLSQLLRLFLPRFLEQLGKDYKAWASGDSSRKALGTGEL